MAKETNKRLFIWINNREIENNIKAIQAEFNKVKNELKQATRGSEEYNQKLKELKKLKEILDEHKKAVQTVAEAHAESKKNIQNSAMAWGGVAAAIQGVSVAVRRFVATTQEYVEAYARMDDAMTNVSKYTGLTREEVKQLNEEFRKMDTRTPTEKLNALAADAGRLGITSKEAIKDFVEAADIINVALGEDLGEDAVKNVGKMATMFGESDRLGLRGAMIATASAVNTLAQSSSASEPYIMDFTARLSGIANTAGITQAQIMGIASAMDQNMGQVEKSATAVQKVMMDMMSKTEKYANLVGMTTEEFRNLVDNDMNTAFLTVIDTFNKINESGPSALAETLADLKLKGAGVQETLLTLASHTDQLREAQSLATQAYADGNSVINEAAAVNSNAAAQLEKAKKAVEDAKAALGEELLPVITELTKGTASGIKVLASIVKFWTQHKALLISLASAYGLLRLAQKAVISSQEKERKLTLANTIIGKAYTLVTKTLALAKAKLAADTTAAAVAQKELKAAFATTPWGAIIVAIGAIATGIGTLVSKQREAKKTMVEFETAVVSEKREVDYLFDRLKKAKEGTDEYKNALERLKERYPDIIQKHIDEEGRLRDIEAAYKDIITQMKSKYAMDARQKEYDKITEKHTKKMVSDYSSLRETLAKTFGDEQVNDMQNTISAMVEDGKNAEEILNRLKNDFGYQTSTDKLMENFKKGKNVKYDKYGYEIPEKAPVNDPVLRYINSLVERHKTLNDEIDETKKKYSPFIEESDYEKMEELEKKLAKVRENMKNYTGNTVESEYQKMLIEERKLMGEITLLEKKMQETKNEHQDSTATDSPTTETEEESKEKLRKRQSFLKKLAEQERKDSEEALNEWEKIKAQIKARHQELIDESIELFGKNNIYIKRIQTSEANAIAVAGQKYLEKTKDFVTKFATELDQMLADTQGDNGEPQSRLVAAIAGSDKEWEKAIAKAEENAKALEKILSDMDENDPLWNDFATQLAAVQDQIDAAQLKQVEARAAITKKFVEEEMKGLKQREKEQQRQIALNRQGITEEQKAALQRQWKIDDLREEYDVEIKLMETALKAAKETNAADTEGIENIEKMIEKLKELRDNVEDTVDAGANGTKKTGNALIDLLTGALTNPQERFRAVLDVMQDFANRAADIYQQIADAQQQSAELDMERFNDAQDAKARKLRQQLDDGLISQKYYDAQMEKMEAEKEQREKKMKHEQFERERKSAIVQALIQGGLAVARGFAEWGWPGGLIVGALTTAETAAQVALIASQVNPYAKGGYIRKKQLALVGEEGQEWVASNSLLEDEETAPVIAALEEYQRGNRNALRLVAPTQPAWKNLSQSASQISSTFASNRTPVEHHYYQSAGNDELLKEVKQMNQFLADPKNRQAYISYKIQTEAQKNRDFIKQAARL